MSVKKQEIEATGADIDEAIRAGLQKLGVSRDQVEVEIIDEGRRGLLGIGGREAAVSRSSRKQYPNLGRLKYGSQNCLLNPLCPSRSRKKQQRWK